MTDRPPSGWAIERAMAIAQSMIADLSEEGVDTDESELLQLVPEVPVMIRRLLRAAKEAEGWEKLCKERAGDLAARRARHTNRADAYRNTALQIIQELSDMFPDGRYKDAEFTATVSAGSERYIVTDDAVLPARFWRVKSEHDMVAINAAAKAGEVVPGVERRNGAPSLTVRSR